MTETKEIETPKKEQPKDAQQILQEQINMSMAEFRRSNRGLFFSSLTAGLEIGFSVLLMATLYTLFNPGFSQSSMQFVLSLGYPLGFIFVIMGRSELFTEHTALAIMPVLQGVRTVGNLLMLWAIVYFGNLIGGLIFSLILAQSGPFLSFTDPEAFVYIAQKMVKPDWSSILVGGILAGWLMGMLGWLVTSSQESLTRLTVIALITFVIGIAALPHCVVGSIEVLTGLLSSNEITLADYGKFQSAATLGNLIGGAVFVSILKFSYIRGQL